MQVNYKEYQIQVDNNTNTVISEVNITTAFTSSISLLNVTLFPPKIDKKMHSWLTQLLLLAFDNAA